jgi:hypothetical protein
MALKTPSRTTVAPRGAPTVPRAAATGDRATPATRTSPREQRELGARIRNPSRHAMFTGYTAFANNVRDRYVDQDFAVTGGQDAGPTVVRGGATTPLCISWHAKGSCFELCARRATHNVLSAAEATTFHT